MKFITNAPKSYRPNDIKLRVLNPAKKELEESDYADLNFNYEDIKRGKKITAFKIHIFHTKNDILETNKLIQQTSPNWDFDKQAIDYLNKNEINFNGKNRDLLKQFFALNGTSRGLEFLEKIKDAALRSSRDNPQGYIIGAIKKHVDQRTLENSGQTDILSELAKMKTNK